MDPINEITKDRSFDESRNVGFVTVQKGEEVTHCIVPGNTQSLDGIMRTQLIMDMLLPTCRQRTVLIIVVRHILGSRYIWKVSWTNIDADDTPL